LEVALKKHLFKRGACPRLIREKKNTSETEHKIGDDH